MKKLDNFINRLDILAKADIYNENEIDEMIMLIRDSFIPAFLVLKDVLVKKLKEAESDWV